MHEQVAIAKKARRYGQNLRHFCPAPQSTGAPKRVVESHL
jgi:hypothetical protein